MPNDEKTASEILQSAFRYIRQKIAEAGEPPKGYTREERTEILQEYHALINHDISALKAFIAEINEMDEPVQKVLIAEALEFAFKQYSQQQGLRFKIKDLIFPDMASNAYFSDYSNRSKTISACEIREEIDRITASIRLLPSADIDSSAAIASRKRAQDMKEVYQRALQKKYRRYELSSPTYKRSKLYNNAEIVIEELKKQPSLGYSPEDWQMAVAVVKQIIGPAPEGSPPLPGIKPHELEELIINKRRNFYSTFIGTKPQDFGLIITRNIDWLVAEILERSLEKARIERVAPLRAI